jgi:hypothetical protein
LVNIGEVPHFADAHAGYARSQLFVVVSLAAVVGQNAMTSVSAANDQIIKVQIRDPQRGKRATIFELYTWVPAQQCALGLPTAPSVKRLSHAIEPPL